MIWFGGAERRRENGRRQWRGRARGKSKSCNRGVPRRSGGPSSRRRRRSTTKRSPAPIPSMNVRVYAWVLGWTCSYDSIEAHYSGPCWFCKKWARP